MKRKRLDQILMEKGIVPDKKSAFVIVTEGRVFVAGQKAVSPAQMVLPDADVAVRGGYAYVGRGAEKLEAALRKFHVEVGDKICADIGAATGGFTQVLLGHGAARVYAIDTARGKLDVKLREDRRVSILERQDVRDLERLPEEPEIVTIDVSLISLRDILPSVFRISPRAEIIALLKPQYETRDARILRRGVVRDDSARERIFKDFLDWAAQRGWNVRGHMRSPIKGAGGNIEYLLYITSAM